MHFGIKQKKLKIDPRMRKRMKKHKSDRTALVIKYVVKNIINVAFKANTS